MIMTTVVRAPASSHACYRNVSRTFVALDARLVLVHAVSTALSCNLTESGWLDDTVKDTLGEEKRAHSGMKWCKSSCTPRSEQSGKK